jgi:hypothetical protein
VLEERIFYRLRHWRSENEKGLVAVITATSPSSESGRHEWIRTTDPHHVKVVL